MSQTLKLCHAPLVFEETSIGGATTMTYGFFTVRGQARIEGVVSSDVPFDAVAPSPTPGPVLQYSQQPPQIDRARVFQSDAGDVSGRIVYPIDGRNLGRYVQLVIRTLNPARVRIEIYARPDNGGDDQ